MASFALSATTGGARKPPGPKAFEYRIYLRVDLILYLGVGLVGRIKGTKRKGAWQAHLVRMDTGRHTKD